MYLSICTYIHMYISLSLYIYIYRTGAVTFYFTSISCTFQRYFVQRYSASLLGLAFRAQ